MNPQTTNRLYEDTNYLERKIVLKNSFAMTFTYDSVFGLYAAIYNDSRKIFSYSNNNFSFDYYVTYNDGTRNRILPNNYGDINTSTNAIKQNVYAQLFKSVDNNGNDFINFYAYIGLVSNPGSTVYTFYYTLYSSRYYDVAI